MEPVRKPFQGVWNIVRFNWHFYVILLGVIGWVIFLNAFFSEWVTKPFDILNPIFCALLLLSLILSLVTSYWIYDRSELYQFSWLKNENIALDANIVNIHAGFDETSELIVKIFSPKQFTVLDFYNPKIHTEVSIKRARKAYPPYPGTLPVKSTQLPLENKSVDVIFVILTAHEIRQEDERTLFFKELHRSLKDDGMIVLTEHLRDFPNFFAFNIGFYHFLPLSEWNRNFKDADLKIKRRISITPFVNTFILKKNGNPS